MGYNITQKTHIDPEGSVELLTGVKDRFGWKTSWYEYVEIFPNSEFEESLRSQGFTHFVCKDFSDRYVTDKDGNVTYNLFAPMLAVKMLKTKMYWSDLLTSSKVKSIHPRIK